MIPKKKTLVSICVSLVPFSHPDVCSAATTHTITVGKPVATAPTTLNRTDTQTASVFLFFHLNLLTEMY